MLARLIVDDSRVMPITVLIPKYLKIIMHHGIYYYWLPIVMYSFRIS